jgi:hypothetical protein
VTNYFNSRQFFRNVSDVIERIIHSGTNSIVDSPSKMISQSAIFIIENSIEKKCSIGKDGSGIWRQERSTEVPFVLTEKGSYQTIQQHSRGFWFYNKRVGSKYVPQQVALNSIFLLKQ